jgi:hypothetical protein
MLILNVNKLHLQLILDISYEVQNNFQSSSFHTNTTTAFTVLFGLFK